MNNEQKANSLKAEDIPSTTPGSKQEMTTAPAAAKAIEQHVAADGLTSSTVEPQPRTDETADAVKQEIAALPEAGPANAEPSVPTGSNKPTVVATDNRQVDVDGSPSSPIESASRTDEVVPPFAMKPVLARKRHSLFEEQPLPFIEMAPRIMRNRTRREVLAFGIGAAAVATGAGYLLPQNTLSRLGVRRDMSAPGKEWLLNRALRIDDDVAEALYSRNRMVPTYTKSQITPIKNNYNGATPEPWYISSWKLALDGLASGVSISLDIRTLMKRFSVHEQITRFVCVEGWSAIAWWAGLRFDDLLRAYPPISQAKWARVESSVNLDNSGNPDPYFVSIDLATARHPQTLLATHHNGQPLTVEHGAPIRLLVPVKLGLKNVKAITRIAYSAEEPRDYWAPYGYSSYDGI